MIKVDIQEIKVNAEPEMLAKITKGIQDGLMALALMGQGHAQKSILKGPKTGVTYKRGKITHQASAPGEAPANDTGFLAANIKAEMTETLTASIVSQAPYSVHLEYGTRHMQPRPFLRPAGEAVREQAKGIVDAYVQAAPRK